MQNPELTVVVATYNGASGLPRLIDSLCEQSLEPARFEVLVVVDGSSDGTWQYLQSVETPFALRFLWQRNQGPAVARNAGVLLARGDVVLSLDDDVQASPDLLRTHLQAHADEEKVAVMGPMVYPGAESLPPWIRWEYESLKQQYSAMEKGKWAPTPRQFYTANASVMREDFLRAGGFDPLFRRAEDVEFAFRLMDQGVSFRHLPAAVVYHRPRRGYRSWQRMAWLYGIYDIVMWRHKQRDFILPLIGREFATKRSPLLQFAARLLLVRPSLLSLFFSLSGPVGTAATHLRLPRVAMACYSACFGLRYLQGAGTALGSPRRLLRVLESSGRRLDS